ncbi:MAG: hypothetical protein Tsb0020_15470 [Haliangiales bacterium]
MNPYREAAATETLEASTREGTVRLERDAHLIKLKIGERVTLSVTESSALLVTQKRRRRKPKQRSILLDRAGLVMARGVPSDEIGVWCQQSRDVVERLVGIRPPELLDHDAMQAWQSVDRIAQRLQRSLKPHSRGVQRALEVGQGADRVLVEEFGERLVFFVRRLFRERAQRVMEVYRDGQVVLLSKRGEQRLRVTSRYGVTALGDYIRFADPAGEDLGRMSIPWISTEERLYLVKLVGQVVHRRSPSQLAAPLLSIATARPASQPAPVPPQSTSDDRDPATAHAAPAPAHAAAAADDASAAHAEPAASAPEPTTSVSPAAASPST